MRHSIGPLHCSTGSFVEEVTRISDAFRHQSTSRFRGLGGLASVGCCARFNPAMTSAYQIVGGFSLPKHSLMDVRKTSNDFLFTTISGSRNDHQDVVKILFRRKSKLQQCSSNTKNATATATDQPECLTCRQCKKLFNPLLNHPKACKVHPAHYGGEVLRKWKSYSYHKVGKEFLYHTEETRAGWGEVANFWDCCGNVDPESPGCTVSVHKSYDDL